MANKKTANRGAINTSYEALKQVGVDAFSSITTGADHDFINQLLGLDFRKKSSNDYTPTHEAEKFDPTKGEIFNITKLQILETKTQHLKNTEKANSTEHFRPGINYKEQLNRNFSHQEIREITSRVDDIMGELRKLISSSKILQVQFAEATINQPPAEVGTYHVNFFEWLLSVIKIARQKVEDSSMWLQTINNKKSKKNGYWGMFKKHGTTFGLSQERSVSTQTG